MAIFTIPRPVIIRPGNKTLSGLHMFQPIAMETVGPVIESAVEFLNDLGHRITSEGQFLFQRLSID